MSNIETVSLASTSPNSTFHTGLSLAASLYCNIGASKPKSTLRSAGSATCAITIFLKGNLGAGKTTFVQGLAKGLGINDAVVSPTFALENRYGETLLHMDLFRVDPKEARKLLEASDDFPGVRAVEWSERMSEVPSPHIIVSLTDPSPTTRTIEITFGDIAWPDRHTIEQWRRDVNLPEHIQLHCDAVGAFAKKCGEELLRRGTITRPEALLKTGELHDLLRFIDFVNIEDRSKQPEWIALAEKYHLSHEEACAEFMEEKKFSALSEIIRPHGLRTMEEEAPFRTIEQKILFYADKRVMGDRVVSLRERFDDLIVRYGKGMETEQAKGWRIKTEELERELFGTDVP